MSARILVASAVLVLALAACGGGETPHAESSSPSPSPTDTATGIVTPPVSGSTVEVLDNEYRPAELTVTAGTTVVWRQTGTATHTVTARDGSFNSHPRCKSDISQCMKPGESFARQFTTPGRFEYFCEIHGNLMAGVVVVT